MAKVVLTPWKNRKITTEVISEKELSKEEIEKVSRGIVYASISCCSPGWRERTVQQIKDVLNDFYGEKFASCILDVKYI